MVTIKYHLEALEFEVGVLKSRLKSEDTGHLHTTISVLEERIQEIKQAYLRHTTRDYNAQVAQLVEHRSEEPSVGGSIPSLSTTWSLSSTGQIT